MLKKLLVVLSTILVFGLCMANDALMWQAIMSTSIYALFAMKFAEWCKL